MSFSNHILNKIYLLRECKHKKESAYMKLNYQQRIYPYLKFSVCKVINRLLFIRNGKMRKAS